MSAPTFPTTIVRAAEAAMIADHSPARGPNPTKKMRAKIAYAASFGPTAKNAEIGVGAPSYTSGAQTWKGADAILKNIPHPTRMIPMTRNAGGFAFVKAAAMPWRESVPVAP